jgi:hypothetical protein
MASSKDFEKLWENYQVLVKSKDVSIVDYCQHNGVVYSQFERWYKKHLRGVSIIPLSEGDADDEVVSSLLPESSCSLTRSGVVYVNIEFSNGLKVCQRNIDYIRLRNLVEKLEELC